MTKMGRLIKKLVGTRIVKWLRKPYIDKKYIFLDRYSWLHLFSGIVLGIIFLILYPLKYSLVVVFGLLLAWELFEILTADIIFRKESTIDIIWDLIIGMLGYFLIKLLVLLF